jgi:Kef-type K+ transport system membrane component KefB
MDWLQATNIDVLLVLLVGLMTVLAMAVRAGLERVGVPPLVGFVGLGMALSAVDRSIPLLTEPVLHAFELLGSLGIVALLFRVGLGSHPQRLWRKLPDASVIWIGNVLVSGAVGYLVATTLLGWSLIPSLIVTVALTATSIGVAVPVWEEGRALDSDNGSLMLDVAELDDISGVILMALLFAVLPTLQAGAGDLWPTLTGTALSLAIRLVAFTVLCVAFAHYLKPILDRGITRWERPTERVLTVAGLGSVIAAFAGALGFSLAIGALFAGLIFSRNAASMKRDRSLNGLYDFLTPFFFIGIGLKVDPVAFGGALGVGAILLAAAVVGKLVGAILPALLTTSLPAATLIGVSLVPRAEIAMVVMDRGHDLGPWAVPDSVYGAMTVVTLASCVLTPLVLGPLLRRWPQT